MTRNPNSNPNKVPFFTPNLTPRQSDAGHPQTTRKETGLSHPIAPAVHLYIVLRLACRYVHKMLFM
jgi:hypothetical protein